MSQGAPCSKRQEGWWGKHLFTPYYDPPSPHWAHSRGTEKIKRPVLPISINVSTFLSFQKGFCISAETLYHVSQSFVLVNTAQTGQLHWEWVQGSPPATATTGHLPSQSKPDTNATYGSCCRTRHASQPLFINVQIGFISWQAEEIWKKKSWSSILFFETNTWRLVGNQHTTVIPSNKGWSQVQWRTLHFFQNWQI